MDRTELEPITRLKSTDGELSPGQWSVKVEELACAPHLGFCVYEAFYTVAPGDHLHNKTHQIMKSWR